MASSLPDSGNKKSVLVLSTGGTLGMRPTGSGPLVPDKVLQDLLTWIPELQNYAEIEVEILADIDSSLLAPPLWLTLARRIEAAQLCHTYSGIVLLHGTDTLAFTASMLSFLLPALRFPVVLTGGQRPLAVTRTDARNNILGAVETALEGPVEVMAYFHHNAFRGNRCSKIAIGDFEGFGSPNFPPLGRAGISWEWNRQLFWPLTRRPTIWPSLPEELPSPPLVIPWIPGLKIESLAPALENQWALVLEVFGTGNMPVDAHLRDHLEAFTRGGGLVMVKSQVPKGATQLDAYQPGRALLEMGVTSGADMTREALVTKLMALKAMGLKGDKLKNLMAKSIAGELSDGT